AAPSTGVPMSTALQTRPDTSRRPSARPVLIATAAGVGLNLVLEVAEAILLPHMRSDLLFNTAAVTVWSVAGLGIALGLLRLGRDDRRRPAVMWVATGLAVLTAFPLFWSAVPASLAGAGLALAAGRSGSATGTRVVALVAL